MFSIVIPSFGRESLLSLLQSIPVDPELDSVFVAMDPLGANDLNEFLSVELAHLKSLPIKHVSPVLTGVNAARNAGIRAALMGEASEFIVFLDDDVELSPAFNWKPLKDLFEDPSLLAVGGNYLSRPELDYFSRGYNLMCNGWRIASGVEHSEALLGGAWCIRAKRLEEVCNNMGWFEDDIIYGGAETAFVHRLRNWAKGSWSIRHSALLDVIHTPARRSFISWLRVTYLQSSRLSREIKTALPPGPERFKSLIKYALRLPPRDRLCFLSFSVILVGLGKTLAAANLFRSRFISQIGK
jgi:glycosyltransferase involved in cell wall biosynthesis